MAILLPAVPFVKVTNYMAALDRVRRAVFRLVDRAGRPICSGWLITDTLAVVPSYVLKRDTDLSCTFDTSKDADLVISLEEVTVTPVDALPDLTSEPNANPVLLRLARPLPGRALVLPERVPVSGEPVGILHHPQGYPQLYFNSGRILQLRSDWLDYDTNTTGGSTGGPLFDSYWNLVGMHQQEQQVHSANPKNSGLLLAAVLRQLRESAAWPEIVAYHKLADVAAAVAALNRPVAVDVPPVAAQQAAVLWRFDPNGFDAPTRDWLKTRVVPTDKNTPLWVLQPGERVKLLHAAGSLAALRAARAAAPPQSALGAGQKAIDRILEGPPFDLKTVPPTELSHWLQAVRWFEKLVPDLPTAAAVNRELGRRRVTGRLAGLVGPTFRGRKDELDALRAWDRAGGAPIVVSGIGGAGKSALVAKFAHEVLEAGRPVLWLDFDRADLAPDDAVSVLAVLAEQAAAQLDGFTAPPVDPKAWDTAVRAFGADLVARSAGKSPLVVLDGFEVAQHVRKHTELWQLLDTLLAAAPATRVLIAGRAPVPGLRLAGRPAVELNVAGLNSDDAREWLRDGGIPNGPVQDGVVARTTGVPLFVRMAVKLVERGVPLGELVDTLPQVMAAEYLDDRVIDRLIDPAVRPFARGVLALRRVTPELLAAVLGDLLPPDLDPADAFERLSREWAIVEETAAATPELVVRPNVRASVLLLLGLEGADRVRAVDRKAADWYAKQNIDAPAVAAERVYHLLRLGDVAGAEAAWRPGCGTRLLFADADLPAGSRARAWLKPRLDETLRVGEGLAAWEAEALERVRDAIRRGLNRTVPSILSERTDRTSHSPLLVYDAYQQWRAGDLTAAREVLGPAPDVGGEVGRARAMFAAMLAARAGDRSAADKYLASIQGEERWADRPEGTLERLAVRAARIRLTVDLAAEAALATRLNEDANFAADVRQILSPLDVVFSGLSRWLEGPGGLESIDGPLVQIPTNAGELVEFGEAIGRLRRRGSGPFVPFRPADPHSDESWGGLDSVAWLRRSGRFIARDLAALANRRWKLATADLFLSDACRFAAALRPKGASPVHSLRVAVVATLAAFLGGQPNSHCLIARDVGATFSELLRDVLFAIRPSSILVPSADRLDLVREFSQYAFHGTGDATAGKNWLDWLDRLSSGAESGDVRVPWLALDDIHPMELRPLFLYLLGSDPLEVLVRRLLEFTDRTPL